MNNDLISRSELKEAIKEFEDVRGYSILLYIIDNAPTVEITETEIKEVLNKRCMTAVTNESLIALHGTRPQGEWKRHDEWRSGEYIGGFYHVNCPCKDGLFVKWRMKYCGNCGASMQLDDEEEGEEHDRENNN